MGEVGEPLSQIESVDGERASVRDAGRRPDAGQAASDEGTDDDTQAERGATRDAGRDAGREAGASPSAQEPASDRACADGETRPPAAGLRIREIALYQTVKVAVFQNGTWVSERSVPIVQGKKTLARVFVDTLPGYAQRPVRGSLRVENDATARELVDERTISANSSDAALESTFSFTLEGAEIGPATALSFALEEPECGASAGDTDAAVTRVPASGAQALTATAIGRLRVVLVPIEIGGRMPNTSDSELDNIRAALLAYYPVPEVELSVRAQPLRWTAGLGGRDSNAWSDLLNQVILTRASDSPESDIYYFGLAQPAATMQAYCSRGCIMGIAPQSFRSSPSTQVGLGASFGDADTYLTIVHELGHAHGRGHAPCAEGGGIQGVDAMFPDRTGATGVWGWDSRSNKLLAPTSKDVMGYCQPVWIGAYNYGALASRAQQVNSAAYIVAGPNPTRWRNLLVYADGSARWGGLQETNMPGGELEPALVLDANGQQIEETEVARVPLSHSSDFLLYLPEPGATWAKLALRDRTLELATVQPPL